MSGLATDAFKEKFHLFGMLRMLFLPLLDNKNLKNMDKSA
jgi:hypothetical protein